VLPFHENTRRSKTAGATGVPLRKLLLKTHFKNFTRNILYNHSYIKFYQIFFIFHPAKENGGMLLLITGAGGGTGGAGGVLVAEGLMIAWSSASYARKAASLLFETPRTGCPQAPTKPSEYAFASAS